MTHPMFSLKALAACWCGLLLALGSGAVALQVTQPPPPPAMVVAAASPPATATPAIEVPAPIVPAVSPMPFENRSLLALLPPPSHLSSLPVPPRPPVRHAVHVEHHHAAPVYVAERARYLDQPDWSRGPRYVVSRYQPYGYPPPAYYGW